MPNWARDFTLDFEFGTLAKCNYTTTTKRQAFAMVYAPHHILTSPAQHMFVFCSGKKFHNFSFAPREQNQIDAMPNSSCQNVGPLIWRCASQQHKITPQPSLRHWLWCKYALHYLLTYKFVFYVDHMALVGRPGR
jgi:hypothetical protein